MGVFCAYILKVAVCLLIFYIFNKLLLSRDTFHLFNRFMWLLVAVASLLLPLFEWQIFGVESVVMDLHSVPFDFSSVTMLPEEGSQTIFLIVTYSLIVYALFAAAMAIRLGISYIQLFLFISPRKKEISRQGDNIEIQKNLNLLENCKKNLGYKGRSHLIVHENDMPAFSWMNYIVISKKDIELDGRDIIIHELSHIKHGHSWDLMAADLLIIFQWFNPAAWLYKQSLQQVHEYTADDSVIRAGVNAKDYQLLLIKKAVGQRLYSMSNSFNHSKLKNRITMMLKKRSNKWALAKCLYALPLAAFAVSAFASPEISTHLDDISAVKVKQNSEIADILSNKSGAELVINTDSELNNTQIESNTIGGIAKSGSISTQEELKAAEQPLSDKKIEVMPKFFDGGIESFRDWVASQIRYPQEALEQGFAGKVVVTFVVKKDGGIKNIEVIENPENSLSQEVVRTVKSSPLWTPGTINGKAVNVSYTLPIEFKLPLTAKLKGEVMSVKVVKSDEESNIKSPSNTHSDNRLIIVDGLKFDNDINSIAASQIESMSVLKNDVAVNTYGEKAKNGVILISLKKDDGSVDNEKVPAALDIKGSSGNAPLYIIDGVECSDNFLLDTLDPGIIKSISVRKDKATTSMYGEKGKDGVIFIITRKDKKQ